MAKVILTDIESDHAAWVVDTYLDEARSAQWNKEAELLDLEAEIRSREQRIHQLKYDIKENADFIERTQVVLNKLSKKSR